MGCFIETNMPVIGFCISQDKCFLLCGSDLIRADVKTGRIEKRTRIFERDGKSRIIQTNGRLIAVSDFCMLSIYHADTLEKMWEQKLGNDLTDDICGLMMDDSFVFACIRNGGMTKIDQSDFSQVSVAIGTASSWSLIEIEDKIYAGTVDGQLLRLDRNSMEVEESIHLSRQNVKSLYRSGSTLYAAGQDKKLYVIDLPSFSLVRKIANTHRMMFDIIGEKDGVLYTVSHPECVICGWDESGTKVRSMPYRLRLSGSSAVFEDAIYISSRNINGVERITLSVFDSVGNTAS